MVEPRSNEPPRDVWFALDEALELLAVLEDARDLLTEASQLVVVVALELQIRELSHKLGFDDPEGGIDAD